MMYSFQQFDKTWDFDIEFVGPIKLPRFRERMIGNYYATRGQPILSLKDPFATYTTRKVPPANRINVRGLPEVLDLKVMLERTFSGQPIYIKGMCSKPMRWRRKARALLDGFDSDGTIFVLT